MSDGNAQRIPAHPQFPSQLPQASPRRHMLMTPQMVAIGGMLAFLTVVFSLVVLPTTTYQPPISDDWLPLSNSAFHGRAVYLANGCVYCHSGFTRPQDVYAGLYYLYPRAAQPGDFRGVSQSPNIMGSARTGPDLSQEGGNHPDTWHVAHYNNPRNTMPLSIMPSFKFLSQSELHDLISFNQSQGGKEAALRYAAIRVGNMLMGSNMGMIKMMGGPTKPLADLIARLRQSGDYRTDGKAMDKSPSGLPWMAVWHINSFERGYWLTPDPLELTQQNLIRGKAIYLKRCAGCHGEKGDGKGTAAKLLHIKPYDFSAAKVSHDPGASDGMLYHRILTGGPGTAMENFGTRLSVQDIWRVVLFLRTVHKGGLREPVPTVNMFEKWTPPKPLLEYISTHPIPANTEDPDLRSADPFMSAARWIAPGMAEGDVIYVGGRLPITPQRLSQLVRATYFELVDNAYADAKGRSEELPPVKRIESVEDVQFHVP